jgi:hypothetical protein
MSRGSLVFLKIRKKPARELLLDNEVIVHKADLLVLAWDFDFSDLSCDQETADHLLSALGAGLLGQHREKRGVLVTPASLSDVQAGDYASGVASYSLAGLWIKNLAHEPGVRLVAADEAEIPLPRFPRSKLVEFYLVKTARAMRELELSEPPLRTVRLELRTNATPREVSAFYLPLLKAEGLTVKRRIWSSGTAERLVATSAALRAFVHSEKRGPGETFIQISWVQLQDP